MTFPPFRLDFWLSQSKWYGQPTVQFNDEVYMQVLEGNTIKTFSSLAKVAEQTSSPVDSLSFSVKQDDANHDQKNELITVSLAFQSTPSDVSSVALLLGFSYELEDTLNVDMTSYAFVNVVSAAGIANVLATGTLELRQRAPFTIGSVTQKLYDVDLGQRLLA